MGKKLNMIIGMDWVMCVSWLYKNDRKDRNMECWKDRGILNLIYYIMFKKLLYYYIMEIKKIIFDDVNYR